MLVMAIDGVLRDSGTREVIPSGRTLYRALTSIHGVALVSDDSAQQDGRWLTSHGFTDHAFVAEGGSPRPDQLARLRTRGSIDFLVEADPDRAAEAVAAGTPVLFFAVPSYRSPDDMPGAKRIPASWDVLQAEVQRQRETKSTDARLGEVL
jgi:hypothetical protein